MERIWTFNTARFTVAFEALPECDLDLSFDDTGEIAERIKSGDLVAFCAKVAVYLDGNEIAADYLGACIYESPEDFRDHIGISKAATKARAKRDIAKAIAAFRDRASYLSERQKAGEISMSHYVRSMVSAREKAAKARREYMLERDYWTSPANHIRGSYFTDMVKTAIAEARQYIADMPGKPTLRAA